MICVWRSVNFKDIPADQLWTEWLHDFESIKRNIHYLFRERRTFRDVSEVFSKNERLQSVGGLTSRTSRSRIERASTLSPSPFPRSMPHSTPLRTR